MNIAPVMKDQYTLGKRTPIPGMGKFDALSQMKVIRQQPLSRTFWAHNSLLTLAYHAGVERDSDQGDASVVTRPQGASTQH